MAEQEHIWVMSNRVDDRVVLFERDAMHPGGEAFVGGNTVAPVGRTGGVERLLREGSLVEIPEPPDGPKKPTPVASGDAAAPANAPGQPTALGRVPDPDLVPDAKKVEAQQARLPDEQPVPAGVVVPTAQASTREGRRG